MKFKNEIPFKDVYFTSTIRDEQGRKLSKSLGNSPDPINIIEKDGADACRFTIIYLSPLGQDVRMTVDVEHQDIPSMEIGRNFANKVWNAGRFLVMNRDMAFLPDVCPSNQDANLENSELSISDRWLLSRLNSTIKNVNYALDNYRVNDYSKILYDFIWRDFCDWYIEIVKVQLNNTSDLVYKQKLTKFTIELYETILKLLHPVMPFLTEEIYHLTNIRDVNNSVSLERIPDVDESMINPKLEEEFSLLQSIVEEIRSLRASLEIPPKHKIPVLISCNNNELVDFFANERDIIETLAKCSKVDVSLEGVKPKNSLSSVVRGIEIFLMLEGAIDIEKEKIRLKKEVDRISRNIENSEKKLSNDNFVSKAPENIIQAEREKLENMKESLKKVLSNLENLE
jgi:valyl-tRNA synthetase